MSFLLLLFPSSLWCILKSALHPIPPNLAKQHILYSSLDSMQKVFIPSCTNIFPTLLLRGAILKIHIDSRILRDRKSCYSKIFYLILKKKHRMNVDCGVFLWTNTISHIFIFYTQEWKQCGNFHTPSNYAAENNLDWIYLSDVRKQVYFNKIKKYICMASKHGLKLNSFLNTNWWDKYLGMVTKLKPFFLLLLSRETLCRAVQSKYWK